MNKLISFGTIGMAGLVGVGVMAFPVSTVFADAKQDATIKREENSAELVVVDDDDDDDTNDTTSGQSRSRTGQDRDNTWSNESRASRDSRNDSRSKVSRASRDNSWSNDSFSRDSRD